MCAFSVTFLSATAFSGSSLFVCLFIRTVSCFISVIEPCKENITLENNNVQVLFVCSETLLKTV